MTVARSLILVLLSFLVGASLALSKAEYTKKEGKQCTYCHPPGKFKELTEAGKYYKEHNHSLEGYQECEAKEKKE